MATTLWRLEREWTQAGGAIDYGVGPTNGAFKDTH